MSDRPILFNAPMVRAILADIKTQTRRVVKDRYIDAAPPVHFFRYLRENCPYGQPGDRLWVRETWRDAGRNSWHYAADGTMLPKLSDRELQAMLAARAPLTWESYTWKPSIHMPRAASRITLEITGVRVERLQDISEADALSEGCTQQLTSAMGMSCEVSQESFACGGARKTFKALWESINGPGSWDENPCVWVIEFRRAQP
jgi:hypothetical protein